MMTDRLACYHNGNTTVELFTDGTKHRTYDGDPQPVYPETIDLKITNCCTGKCAFCSEDSTPDGAHADLDWTILLLDTLPAGVEIALGGGDPLQYPELEWLLNACTERGLIANLTISDSSICTPIAEQLIQWLHDRRIYGLGVSNPVSFEIAMDNPTIFPEWTTLAKHPNVVSHYIAGIHSPQSAIDAPTQKVLILGFKRRGRAQELKENLAVWRYWLPALLASGKIVSFDCLAVEQLGLRQRIDLETWDRHYLGDDGHFSLFVDAVTQQYAVSSSHEIRYPIAPQSSIGEVFAHVRDLATQ